MIPKVGTLIVWLPLGFLTVFFFYPLGLILGRSLSAAAIHTVFTTPTYWRIIAFTTGQATLSTLLTLLVGLPVAYLFARFNFPGKTVFRALVTLPFVMPTVVVAAAFRTLFGSRGLLNVALMAAFNLDTPPIQLEQTLTLILLAHVFYNIAVVVRLVGGFWANLNPRLEEAAATLGANRRQQFWEVTLPLLRPPLLSAALLIFIFTFTSFGVILILGGPQFSTIETEIYRQYVTFLRPDAAAILSLVQMGITFALMTLYTRWQRQATVGLDLRPQQATLRYPQTWREKGIVYAILGLTILFLGAPLLALVIRSVLGADGQLTGAFYRALNESRRGSITFIPPLVAIRNSMGYALLTVILASGMGVAAASWLARPGGWGKWLEPLFMLPLGVSAVTLGFGYVITFHWLRTSPLLVLIAHTLVAFPFVVRSVLPVWLGIRQRLRDAAATLGASPAQVWREVDLPIVGRALLVGALFAFTVSMGEFGATSFIIRPDSNFLTIPIAIERYLSQPGALNIGQAVAMSTILLLVCATGFIAIERFRYADIGEF
ncbi:MAG: iron ABC transporter permease [Chloroflexi bacterium]|nr:iron ABC transporter permease [Chloroflexota bacterium]MBP8055037.1 iron ABC transporter permease [Chloroflexota bacterium]